MRRWCANGLFGADLFEGEHDNKHNTSHPFHESPKLQLEVWTSVPEADRDLLLRALLRAWQWPNTVTWRQRISEMIGYVTLRHQQSEDNNYIDSIHSTGTNGAKTRELRWRSLRIYCYRGALFCETMLDPDVTQIIIELKPLQPAILGPYVIKLEHVSPAALSPTSLIDEVNGVATRSRNDPAHHHILWDASAEQGSLMVRYPQAGDRWQALGAPGHKSLMRWLRDKGMSLGQRQQQPVVYDQQGPIWIPGFTIAERVKCTAMTKLVRRAVCDCRQDLN